MIADEFMFKHRKELECKVCGTKFSPLNENRYTIKRNNFFTKAEEECDAFDCPICGCQIVANTRYPKKYDSVEVEFDRIKKNIDMLKCDESTLSKMQMAIDDFGIKKEGDEYVYKGSRYDWYQMRQIRIGLEKGLDISTYADPKYTADQMERMRLGLEEDLESYY